MPSVPAQQVAHDEPGWGASIEVVPESYNNYWQQRPLFIFDTDIASRLNNRLCLQVPRMTQVSILESRYLSEMNITDNFLTSSDGI